MASSREWRGSGDLPSFGSSNGRSQGRPPRGSGSELSFQYHQVRRQEMRNSGGGSAVIGTMHVSKRPLSPKVSRPLHPQYTPTLEDAIRAGLESTRPLGSLRTNSGRSLNERGSARRGSILKALPTWQQQQQQGQSRPSADAHHERRDSGSYVTAFMQGQRHGDAAAGSGFSHARMCLQDGGPAYPTSPYSPGRASSAPKARPNHVQRLHDPHNSATASGSASLAYSEPSIQDLLSTLTSARRLAHVDSQHNDGVKGQLTSTLSRVRIRELTPDGSAATILWPSRSPLNSPAPHGQSNTATSSPGTTPHGPQTPVANPTSVPPAIDGPPPVEGAAPPPPAQQAVSLCENTQRQIPEVGTAAAPPRPNHNQPSSETAPVTANVEEVPPITPSKRQGQQAAAAEGDASISADPSSAAAEGEATISADPSGASTLSADPADGEKVSDLAMSDVVGETHLGEVVKPVEEVAVVSLFPRSEEGAGSELRWQSGHRVTAAFSWEVVPVPATLSSGGVSPATRSGSTATTPMAHSRSASSASASVLHSRNSSLASSAALHHAKSLSWGGGARHSEDGQEQPLPSGERLCDSLDEETDEEGPGILPTQEEDPETANGSSKSAEDLTAAMPIHRRQLSKERARTPSLESQDFVGTPRSQHTRQTSMEKLHMPSLEDSMRGAHSRRGSAMPTSIGGPPEPLSPAPTLLQKKRASADELSLRTSFTSRSDVSSNASSSPRTSKSDVVAFDIPVVPSLSPPKKTADEHSFSVGSPATWTVPSPPHANWLGPVEKMRPRKWYHMFVCGAPHH